MLYTRMCTPVDAGLLIPILLTGRQQPVAGAPSAVQVLLPIGCAYIFGDRVEKRPKTPREHLQLWVDPADLRHNDGRPCSITDVCVEIADVREQLRTGMICGPLEDRWP